MWRIIFLLSGIFFFYIYVVKKIEDKNKMESGETKMFNETHFWHSQKKDVFTITRQKKQMYHWNQD